MACTRTGSIPIGMRGGGNGWRDDIYQVIAFARGEGFEGIDLASGELAQCRIVLDAGLRLGTLDLPQPWTDLAATDAARRKDAAQRMAQFIRDAVAIGVHNFFVVALPEEFDAERKVNLERAADGYGQLCQAVADSGARILLEGWPGPEPLVPSLACTPESCRALFDAVDSDVLGVNYDPSHLIRMQIDPVRFLAEFIDRVGHVHAKDTLILTNDLYEYGNRQPATLAKPHGYGGHHWRYTIPGHGTAPWPKLLAMLAHADYHGMVSVELEDEEFCGTEQAERRGFIASRDFLIHA